MRSGGLDTLAGAEPEQVSGGARLRGRQQGRLSGAAGPDGSPQVLDAATSAADLEENQDSAAREHDTGEHTDGTEVTMTDHADHHDAQPSGDAQSANPLSGDPTTAQIGDPQSNDPQSNDPERDDPQSDEPQSDEPQCDDPQIGAAGATGATEATEATEAADAVTRLLGPANLNRAHIASNTGIPPELTRKFWQALGFAAAPNDDDSRYTASDQEAILQVIEYLSTGEIDVELALAMTRAIAGSVGRLASWQASLVMEEAVRMQIRNSCEREIRDGTAELPDGLDPGSPPADLAAAIASEREADESMWNQHLSPAASRAAGERLLEMVDNMEPLIIYAWKRHLAAAIGRLMTNDSEGEAGGAQRAVGFADMVGFTNLVRRLSQRQLARLVGRFEVLASEIVARHGGQIVKTLGDEVVYVADTAACAALISLDLLESVAQDASMPDLRIGLAHGPVLSHLGDVFGTTVNRASRLTNLAQPHTVVIDDSMATALKGALGVEMSRLPPRALRGLGITVVWHLWRAAPPAAEPGTV